MKRIIFSKPMLWVMLFLSIFFAVAALKAVYGAYSAYQQRKVAALRAQNIQQEKANLESKIERLGTPEGLEKEAKERFNVKKPGEEVLVIVDPKGGATSSKNNKAGGFWGFVMSLFGR